MDLMDGLSRVEYGKGILVELMDRARVDQRLA